MTQRCVPLFANCVTEAIGRAHGSVMFTGSHGGLSAGRYALQAGPRFVAFNDAGIGREGSGIAALKLLQAAGIAACAVSHTSARIGDARSTLEHGVVSHANEAAQALGVTPGVRLRDWLAGMRPDRITLRAAGSSPARR